MISHDLMGGKLHVYKRDESPFWQCSTYCKSTTGAVVPFQRLKKRNRPKPEDLVFPKSHHVLFNRILGEEGLKKDREGQSRTTYSLRHTYICLQLMEGADIYTDREELPYQCRHD